MANAILKVEKLNVRYGSFTAVQDATLEIPAGGIVALVGANGAGKTTLVNAIAGLHKPMAGELFFNGDRITDLPPDAIVNMGISVVPQGDRCFPRMSVKDNLLMGSYPVAARKYAQEMLARVYKLFPALQEKKNDPVWTLSGGQRQMVAIGRALMSRPKCMIIDEISSGLSPAVVKDIYRQIVRINQTDGVGILMIEQDTQRVLEASQFFCVMRRGKTVLSGRSFEIDTETLKKNYFGI